MDLEHHDDDNLGDVWFRFPNSSWIPVCEASELWFRCKRLPRVGFVNYRTPVLNGTVGDREAVLLGSPWFASSRTLVYASADALGGSRLIFVD